MRIGFGYDVHKFSEDRMLILGGVDIPYEKGLIGHSDADVLTHSIMDSLLGALALGDIGGHFPDTDMKYKNISSIVLLEEVYNLIKDKGYSIGNIDATIAAEAPKLAGYIEQMKINIAKSLNTSIDNISIKATTSEKIGFIGRKEGISSYCISLLMKDK